MMDDGIVTRQTGRHSLYSTLVPFPIACFILTFLTDVAYWATASVLWETMSVWLLVVGLIAGSLTALAGCVDLVRSRRIRGLGQPWLAVSGHAAAFGLSIVNVFVHSRDGYTAVVPEGLVLSTLVVVVLLATALLSRTGTSPARAEGLA